MMKLWNNKTVFAMCAGLALILLPGCDSKTGTPSEYTFSGDGTAVPGNTAPVADAGMDQTVNTNETVTLDGSGSSDADGDTLTYEWTMTEKPAGSNTVLSDTSVVNPTFVPDIAGEYTIQLVVNDGVEDSMADEVVITAEPFISLSTFQAANVVIGQSDFNETDSFGSSANAQNYSGGMYSNAIVVNEKLYIGDEGFNRVLGYNSIPQINGAAADFVLGQEDFNSSNSGDAANEMSSPHIGAYTEGKFFIVEYNGRRVLIYNTPPTETNASADLVIGESDFGAGDTGGCLANRLGAAEAISAADGKLVIADSSQNRILIYNTIPTENNASADLVLGQADFTSCSNNRGDALPAADTLSYPAGIWTDGKKLVVNDRDNNRVLIWNTFPTEIGQAADIVLGQSDFNMSTENDDNQDGIADAAPSARTLSGSSSDSMNGLYSNERQLFVADIDNNRVLVWNEFPTTNFEAADVVIGQSDFNMSTANDDDQDGISDATPSARTLSFPNGLYQYQNKLFILDDGNARVLIFNGQ